MWQLVLKVGFFRFVWGCFLCIISSMYEFCSQEHWALADDAVGVEEAWYFLGKEVKLLLPNLGMQQVVRAW